jgi:[ribosomal protein S5]-alanine N-acetyltransferase
MKIFAETDRLILRELLPTDEDSMFELDSNPEVHKYLGNQPVKSIDEIRMTIQSVRQQYIDHGIGRWAVVEKSSGEFVGWSGLKLIKELTNNHINFYDVGYRLIPKFWGKGYATESARASLKYAFEEMYLNEVFGIANIANIKSRKALEKSGLKFIEIFDRNGIQCDWFKITREEWVNRK